MYLYSKKSSRVSNREPKKDEPVYDSQEEIAKKLNLMKK